MEDLLAKMQELLSDPESMKQISELAQMFKSGEMDTSESNQETPPPNPPAFDPGLFLKASEMFHQQDNDKNIALLTALRPHLGQPRQEKLDKAVRLLRLWHIWKQLQASGMLQNLL